MPPGIPPDGAWPNREDRPDLHGSAAIFVFPGLGVFPMRGPSIDKERVYIGAVREPRRRPPCMVRGIQRVRRVNRHTAPLALYRHRTGSVTRTPPPLYTTAGYRLPLQQARRLPICGPPVASATMAGTMKNTVFPKKNVKSCVDISKVSKVQHLGVDLRYTVYRGYETPCVTHHRRRYKGGAGDTTPPSPLYTAEAPRTRLQRDGNHDAARKGDRPRGRYHGAKERRTLCRK